jgi:N-acetylmuramic acid 6-phosphate etherase
MTNQSATALYLGIEGGGTRTTALLANEAGELVRRLDSGPANFRLLNDAALLRRFRELARRLPRPSALGVCFAGARDRRDWDRLAALASKVWPGIPCLARHDLESAIAAAALQSDGTPVTRVIILSGTGSCCYARNPAGKTAKLGGWGHLLGDKGSGYEIGLRALKAVVYYLDRDGVWSPLGRRILRRLQLNEPDDLVGWVQQAAKDEIASLAVEVFAAWAGKDRIAGDILEGAAISLAKDGVSCARRLESPGAPLEFVLNGSVLLRQPRFAREVAKRVKKLWRGARCVALGIESAWGAVALARQAAAGNLPVGAGFRPRLRATVAVEIRTKPATPKSVPESLSPTEQRNPRSVNLHTLSFTDGIRLMLSEEGGVPAAVLAEKAEIERALKLVVRAFRNEGRLFYVGAGTSGRLGVLDASECPPTFRTDPDLVQGVIAGGQRALWQAVEGAEDDSAAGARAMDFRDVTVRDVVVGIAASGRTPFVLGALIEARRRGAATVLVCFHPGLKFPRNEKPSVIIAPRIGPEVLTGSTRLKSGTATKLILNILTTLAMVKMGKVISNLMIDVNPSNTKLRERAIRIVRELSGCGVDEARRALEESRWVVKDAWHALTPRRRKPR